MPNFQAFKACLPDTKMFLALMDKSPTFMTTPQGARSCHAPVFFHLNAGFWEVADEIHLLEQPVYLCFWCLFKHLN